MNILNPQGRRNAVSRFITWCREGELNPQGAKHRRILSPLRLPVPPSRPIQEKFSIEEVTSD